MIPAMPHNCVVVTVVAGRQRHLSQETDPPGLGFRWHRGGHDELSWHLEFLPVPPWTYRVEITLPDPHASVLIEP